MPWDPRFEGNLRLIGITNQLDVDMQNLRNFITPPMAPIRQFDHLKTGVILVSSYLKINDIGELTQL